MEHGCNVGGYVLAGGRSSRMGREKALLTLGGKLLIEHAVTKLRQICGEYAILSSNPALAAYGPLVPDAHPGCGPMGGMEAALLHSSRAWNLFLPVDVPFLPAVYLKEWIEELPRAEAEGARVRVFTVDGIAQPTAALVHREVRPFLTEALELGRYKLLPVLKQAASELAGRRPGSLEADPFGRSSGAEFASGGERVGEVWEGSTEARLPAQAIWFANLNTPEELADAELHLEMLDG